MLIIQSRPSFSRCLRVDNYLILHTVCIAHLGSQYKLQLLASRDSSKHGIIILFQVLSLLCIYMFVFFFVVYTIVIVISLLCSGKKNGMPRGVPNVLMNKDNRAKKVQ